MSARLPWLRPGLVVVAATLWGAACGPWPYFWRTTQDGETATTTPAVAGTSPVQLHDPRWVSDQLTALVAEGAAAPASPAQTRRAVTRAHLLLDAVVVARVLERVEPQRADELLQVVESHLGLVEGSDAFAVALAIDGAMRVAQEPPLRIERMRALLAPPPELDQPEVLWLQWSDDDPFFGPRARLLALRSAMERLGPWLRTGTASGDGSMVRDCAFLCAPAERTASILDRALAAGWDAPVPAAEGSGGWSDEELAAWTLPRTGDPDWAVLRRQGPPRLRMPQAPQSPFLWSPQNFLDATLLLRLHELAAAVRQDVERGEAVSVGASAFVDRAWTRVRTAVVPVGLTPGYLAEDYALDVPHWLAGTEDASAALVRPPAWRLVVVRSDGVRVAARPMLQANEAGQVVWAGGDDGVHLPGVEGAAFERLGSLAVSAVVDGRVPQLLDAIGQIDTWLHGQEASQMWDLQDRAVGLLVDGGVYASTLLTLTSTLSSADWQPVVYQADPDTGRLVALPLQLAAVAPTNAHILAVRPDGYLLFRADALAGTPVVTARRADGGALPTLYRAILEARAEGGWLGDLPIHIRVDDQSTDWGMVAHLTAALSFVRADGELARDRDLLRAPVAAAEGAPVPLVPGGLVLAGGS